MHEKKRIFLYVSAICFHNYLALENGSRLTWGGLVHLNIMARTGLE